MNGSARISLEVPEACRKNSHAKGREEKSVKCRVQIIADSELLRKKLVFVLEGEKEFEVVGATIPLKNKPRNFDKILDGEKAEIGVMFSCGLVLEDLHRVYRTRAETPGIKILFLGASQEDVAFLQYVRAGINGFLPGDASVLDVISGLRALRDGEAVCGGAQCAILFRYFEKEAETFPSAALHRDLGLTRREQQLIPLLTRGLTNKEIANHFSLSEQTVKNHLYRMKRKVGAHGRLEIVDVCRQHGFPA